MVTELGRLIETASRANHGRSMQAASDLATRRGVPISKSLISKVSRKVDTITPLLVRGLAAGYDISEEDIVRAALADLGFPIADYSISPESALIRDPELGAGARTILLAALKAARELGPGSVALEDGGQQPEEWPSGWVDNPEATPTPGGKRVARRR